ncbi:MAG: DUF4139 domain-containing protein [Synergistaceae bacterium]|nr:DUF4139 domain-containing protein [Synergistaceae bacterium]
MRTLLISFALLIMLSLPACSAEIPDTYSGTIASLNFYPSGAKFVFLIEPQDEDGNFEAYLPGAFTPESIKLLNPENVYGDIRTERRSRTRWTPPQLAELKAQQEEQAETVSSLTAKQSSLEQTLSLLKKLEPDNATNPLDLLKYITSAQELRQKTEDDLADLKTELAAEKEKLTMLNSEVNTRRPAGESSYLVITGRAKGTVRVEAFTGSASWRPRYTLNMDSNSGDIEVQMFIRASQRTGLDYTGPFTLHTKTPDENISTPDLQPLKVGIRPKSERVLSTSGMSVMRTNRMYESAKMAAPMMEDMDMMAEEETADSAYSAPRASGPAVQESLSDRAVNVEGTITGDGNEREFEVALGGLKLSATPIIMLIPEQKDKAWIIASMDEENDKLIPGQAELRVDNYPSGRIFIEEFGTGQRRVPFGYADQITVKKESLIGKTGVSWFSGVFTSGYKLQITNGTKTDKLITVRDRLPVPTDEKIKLDVKRIEPKEKEKDAENRYTWEISVPAGKTETIIVDYTLSYPSGEELQYR